MNPYVWRVIATTTIFGQNDFRQVILGVEDYSDMRLETRSAG